MVVHDCKSFYDYAIEFYRSFGITEATAIKYADDDFDYHFQYSPSCNPSYHLIHFYLKLNFQA